MSRPDPEPRPRFRYVLSYDLTGAEAAFDTAATAWNPPSDRQTFKPELMAGAFATLDGPATRIVTRPFPPDPVTNRIRTDSAREARRGAVAV